MSITYDNTEFEQNLGYTAQDLLSLFSHFSKSRKPYERLWKVLDAFDRGYFWESVQTQLPKYSIKPDTNWVHFVKSAIVDSLYTGSYRGDVFPRSKNYKHVTNEINEFIEYVWDKLNISHYILKAGERAALLNFGAVEIGWNSDVIDGADKLFHGDLEVKHIDNMSLVLDPSAEDPYKGRAMFTMEEISLVELKNENRFRERIEEYEQKIKEEEQQTSLDQREYGKGYYKQRPRESKDGTVRLLTCFYKYQPSGAEEYRIDKVWMIQDGYILSIQKDIKPKTFPIRILYSSPPIADPYGTPKTKLIMYNAMAINILDSIESTHIYSSWKRPKIVSRKSGINEGKFAREGNNPDKLWVVDGDPNKVVQYINVPDLPHDRHLLKERLETAIMRISGIDDRYLGRDTGSAQTTGAMDIMNQRISMSDNTRIAMLKEFIKNITELILKFYIEYGGKERQYPKYRKNGQIDDIKEINFEQMKKDQVQFDFVVNVTPHLPNNVMRRAEVANIIMEKQMQYNMNPPLITPEEWLEYQDFPQKYHIMERIYQDRMRDDREEIMSDMVNYAGMVDQGMRPESAIDQLAQERQFKREQPGLGNTGNANSFQNRQK